MLRIHRRPRRRHWLASSAFALCVSGCAPDDERSRIVTELPRDGYALFKVSPGGAERVAILVEMRDVREGTFVLLYTPAEPKSSGWFALDTSAYTPCREGVTIDCVIPNGHGALADVAFAKPGGSMLVLRHQLGDEHDEEDDEYSSSSSSKKTAPSGFYAVMRIEKDGSPTPMAVEVISMDDVDPHEKPEVERIR